MVLKRLIPSLLYDGKGLVKTVKFKKPSYVGDPINAVKIFNDKEVDELILIDINASKEKRKPHFNKIKEIASECFMPFSYGGGVRTIDDFQKLFSLGVEKVVVNSLLTINPKVVKEAVAVFGSQSVIASVDIKRSIFAGKKVHAYLGDKIKMDILTYCKYLQDEIGVGELFLTSVDQEGTWGGYDKELIRLVVDDLRIPVIAHGGAGNNEDVKSVLYELGANAAAIGSMAVYQKKGMGVLINFPTREKIIIEHDF